ncbi:MAG TPA: hypothetical protein ENK06_13595 [Gammaproteobacteria bacterium]|nr:hypothetical protein [Gammaproteobacteria bacterium]
MNGEKVGEVPFSITLDRDVFKNKFMTFKKNGYISKDLRIKKTIDKTSLFNFTMWPSWLTDATSGNMMEYYPGRYLIELEAKGSATYFDSEKVLKRFITFQFTALKRDLARLTGDSLNAINALSIKAYGQIPNWQDPQVTKKIIAAKNPIEIFRIIESNLVSPTDV